MVFLRNTLLFMTLVVPMSSQQQQFTTCQSAGDIVMDFLQTNNLQMYKFSQGETFCQGKPLF